MSPCLPGLYLATWPRSSKGTRNGVQGAHPSCLPRGIWAGWSQHSRGLRAGLASLPPDSLEPAPLSSVLPTPGPHGKVTLGGRQVSVHTQHVLNQVRGQTGQLLRKRHEQVKDHSRLW